VDTINYLSDQRLTALMDALRFPGTKKSPTPVGFSGGQIQ